MLCKSSCCAQEPCSSCQYSLYSKSCNFRSSRNNASLFILSAVSHYPNNVCCNKACLHLLQKSLKYITREHIPCSQSCTLPRKGHTDLDVAEGRKVCALVCHLPAPPFKAIIGSSLHCNTPWLFTSLSVPVSLCIAPF